MPIVCTGCSRTYEDARFEGGRTFRCACGTQVAGPTAGRDLATTPRRFAVDAMLGALARWLRILGFDSSHDRQLDDARLVQRAVSEQRVLLTRDRRLASEWTVEGIVLLASEKPMAQLSEVDRIYALGPTARLFTRCSRCNAPLASVCVAHVEQRLPETVRRSVAQVRECPCCRRLYWEGSHTARMRRMLAEIIPALGVSDPAQTS